VFSVLQIKFMDFCVVTPCTYVCRWDVWQLVPS